MPGSNAMFQSELWTKLDELDADLSASHGYDYRFEMTIVGSGALLLLGILSPERATTDIDVLEASQEVAQFLDRYEMNMDVHTFFYEFPDSWASRKMKLDFEGAVLDVFILSLEDLAISKLRAYRRQDQADLVDIATSGSLDWELLDRIIQNPLEVQASMEPDEWQSFIFHYEAFKELNNGK